MFFQDSDLAGIKNIIFDLGGVLLNLDFNATISTFENLGAKDFSNTYSKNKQSEIFNLMDKGLISESDFIKGLKDLGKLDCADEEMIKAWNAMLLDFPLDKYVYLKSMADDGYRLFLLSNTNSIHEKAFEARFLKEYGHPLASLFEKAYYSHHIQLRKPDIEIFKFVLDDNTLNPNETLFIDDTEMHVNGAKQAGIHAIHYLIQ
jgi:glucose-1-phosphatase